MLFLLLLFAQLHAGTITQGVTAPIASLDPFSLTGIEAYSVTGNVLEALARSNPQTGEIVPVLAESWSFSPSQKTFKVKLRDRVEFHNGQRLTSEDVKFTFDAFFDPQYKGQLWQGMWSDIASVKVIDPHVVEFKMKNWRYESFEALLTSMRILPKSFYAPADKEKFRMQIVGTGPYRFKRFDANRSLELEPNPKWWNSRKAQHSLVIKRIATPELAVQMMAKRALDFYRPPAEFARGIQTRGFKIEKLRSGLGHGLWLDLNMARPLFKSAKLREALLLVWRREDLNRQVFNNELQLALDAFSPNTDIYPEGEPQKDSLEKARRLLQEEGWTDKDRDSVLEKGDQKLDFTVTASSADQERWLTLLQADAQRAGIKIRITRIEEESQLYRIFQEGKFDAASGGGGLMNEASRLAFHTRGPYNFTKFSNPEIDRLMERLETEFDLKKRRLILRKVIEFVRRTRAQIPGLISPEDFFMTSSRLQIDRERPVDASLWQLH